MIAADKSQMGDGVPQMGGADSQTSTDEAKQQYLQDEDGRQDGVSDHEDLDDELLDLEEAELELEEEQVQVMLELERKRDNEKTARTEVAARRQALAEKKANIEAMKKLLHGPAKRQLDFGTPYTNNMPNMYAAAIKKPVQKQARRQTMAVLDEDGEDVESELMIRVPMPDKFDGTGLSTSSNDPSESVQVRLAHALDAIVDYIEFMCDFKGVTPSARQFVKLACRFLTGTAAGVYKNLQLIAKQEAERRGDTVPILVLWPEVRRALEVRFGKPQPGHQLIRLMIKLKQKPGESVECYTVRFDSLHMELTRQDLASRDITVALYIEGLTALIKEKVEEVVNSIDYFERENIGVHEARKAITALQLIATARETHLASSSRHQQITSAPSRPSQQASPSQQSSNSQQTHGSHGSKKGGDHYNRVPDSLYSERCAAGLCGKCNSASHSARDCTGVRNLLPVTRRNGARANKMNVSDRTEDDAEPKNE